MAKIDFDNLLKVFKGNISLNAGSIASVELDFEIPRGFIIKIKKIILQFMNWSEDYEGLAQGETTFAAQGALIRDPDDTTTIQIPAGRVQHDVLAEAQLVGYLHSVTNENLGPTVTGVTKIYDFNHEDDIVSARNLRLNVVGQGNDSAVLTETVFQSEVHYTLEKVTDIDILNLLDIL